MGEGPGSRAGQHRTGLTGPGRMDRAGWARADAALPTIQTNAAQIGRPFVSCGGAPQGRRCTRCGVGANSRHLPLCHDITEVHVFFCRRTEGLCSCDAVKLK